MTDETTRHASVEQLRAERDEALSWRIAGVGSHFGPFVSIDGIKHDQVIICWWKNQIQPIWLRLPGQAYVERLEALMAEHGCDEVTIYPVRHAQRVTIKKAELLRLARSLLAEKGEGA
jgi:hypothetical protein